MIHYMLSTICTYVYVRIHIYIYIWKNVNVFFTEKTWGSLWESDGTH